MERGESLGPLVSLQGEATLGKVTFFLTFTGMGTFLDIFIIDFSWLYD